MRDFGSPTSERVAAGAEAAVVIPVKSLERGKSRLVLSPDGRRGVMLDLLARTVSAALGSPLVAVVVVVTPDRAVADVARGLGARHLDEQIRHSTIDGPDGAFAQGRRWVRTNTLCTTVVLLVGDLLAPDPDELGRVVEEHRLRRRPLLVPDRAGTGTTCLVHAAPRTPPLAFGAGSAARHEAVGYAPVWAHVPSLRHDVDIVDDLVLP